MFSFSNSSKTISIFFTSTRNHKLFNSQSRSISITAPVPTHDQISHLILEQKSASEALHAFRWASKLPHFTHTQSTYRALVHKLCTFRHFDTAHQLLDEMPSSIGAPPDDTIFVTIIRGLGNARMVRQTLKVLELVSKFKLKPNLKIYNSILDVLVKEDIDIARGFYRRKMMACGVKGDMYTFGILIKGLCLTNRISDAFKLLQFMKRNNNLSPNTIIYNTLIHALCKNGKLGVGRARSLMKEIVNPNNVTFNILINAYCKEDNIVQALVMLEKCFDLGFVPHVITTTKVMESLCDKNRAMEAMEVLERVEMKGGEIDVVAYNTLVKGFCKIKKPKVAYRLLKEMELKGCFPNVDTYNSLICGFCELDLFDSALDLFHEMKRVGIVWNFDAFDVLIRGFCSKGRVEDGFKILELMEDCKSVSLNRISPYNSIIYGFYRAGQVDSALVFLAKMGTRFPRVVDRSKEILRFCEEGRMGNAKKTYDEMVQEGGVASVVVYVSLILGFCKEKMVRDAFEIVDVMVSCGYVLDVVNVGVLVNLLCGEGRIGNALLFLEDMAGRGWLVDSGSYSPLIEGFCRRGDLHKGLMLFLEMVEKGIVPDYFAWNCVVECVVRESERVEWNKTLEWLIEA